MEKKDASLVPKFKENLHWSLHSTHGNAIVTPIDFGDDIPFQEQRAHIDWVYDYCLEIEGKMSLAIKFSIYVGAPSSGTAR